MSSSIKNKTITGVGWSAAESFLGQGVNFIVGLVLARLLSPSEYGLIGITTILTTILSGFVDCGFSNSLIRKKDISNDDYNTMFIVNLATSLAMYAVLYVVAPWIAVFFEREELITLTRVTGLILFIQALSIVQNTILTKRIDFKTKTKASLIASVLSGSIGITMAYSGFGVWSLVVQMIANQTFSTLCLWIFNKWLPLFKFNKKSFGYMWGFGWKLMVSGLLDRTWAQLYQTVVGKCYAYETLGQYTRANDYAQVISHNFTSIIQRVTYPALSEIQDDKQRLKEGYRKIIKLSMFVTAVCMISLGAISEPLIYCLIGDKWHQAATFLPLICVTMSMFPLHSINLNMLQVQGRSDLFLTLEVIKKIIGIGPLCLGIFVNIYWMLASSIVTTIVCFFLNSHWSGKMIGYSSWRQLKDIAPSYSIACIIALSVYFLKFLPLTYWIILPLQIAVGVGIFFLICKIIKIQEYQDIKGIAEEYLKKIKRK